MRQRPFLIDYLHEVADGDHAYLTHPQLAEASVDASGVGLARK